MNKPLHFSGRMVKLGSGQSRASSEICTLDEHKQKKPEAWKEQLELFLPQHCLLHVLLLPRSDDLPELLDC